MHNLHNSMQRDEAKSTLIVGLPVYHSLPLETIVAVFPDWLSSTEICWLPVTQCDGQTTGCAASLKLDLCCFVATDRY